MSSAFEKTFIREDRYMMFLEGLGNTLIVTLGATVLGVLIGALIAVIIIIRNRRKKK